MVNGHLVGLSSCIALVDSCNTAKITQLEAHITICYCVSIILWQLITTLFVQYENKY